MNDPEHEQKWRELQIAYANAMWTFAAVESSLFTTYLAAIGGLQGDMRPAREAHFASNSFEVRLGATDAAVKQRWARDKTRLAIWKALYISAREVGRQRGRIAHKAGHHLAGQSKEKPPLYVLIDPFWHRHHPRSWGEAKSIGINASQLRGYQHQWHAVFFALSKFGEALWAEGMPLKQPPTSPATPETPPKAPRYRKARSKASPIHTRRGKLPDTSPP